MDLLYAKSELYLQQPTMFYYPGLPQRAFYHRSEFPWVAGIEAQSDALREEYLALTATDQPFAPYIRRSTNRPASSSALLEDLSWGAAYLWEGGERTALAAHCPVTMAALETAPIPHIAGRSPMALYSRLTPGTHIAPHHGLLNTRLICHLPLIVPDGCAIRVGADTREWRFGEVLIFDDSIEHEAWNQGSTDRTIILFEIWRPEIPEGDRALLSQLFTAIDAADPARGQEQG
jgi:aspartyl/asparaginyl beta-hydroxylase (cupin superfamily)